MLPSPTEIAEGWRQVLSAGPPLSAARRWPSSKRTTRLLSGPVHCVGITKGTDAIELALRALGVGPGDECILPANTFIATAEAVCRAGATPVLVDCADDGRYLMDCNAVEAAVTERTRALIPVHLYGQAAPVERLMDLADGIDAYMVEDTTQSQGHSPAQRVPAGALGHAAATSFYPGKNLGPYGDAGAVFKPNSVHAAAVCG